MNCRQRNANMHNSWAGKELLWLFNRKQCTRYLFSMMLRNTNSIWRKWFKASRMVSLCSYLSICSVTEPEFVYRSEDGSAQGWVGGVQIKSPESELFCLRNKSLPVKSMKLIITMEQLISSYWKVKNSTHTGLLEYRVGDHDRDDPLVIHCRPFYGQWRIERWNDEIWKSTEK